MILPSVPAMTADLVEFAVGSATFVFHHRGEETRLDGAVLLAGVIGEEVGEPGATCAFVAGPATERASTPREEQNVSEAVG